MKAIFTFILLLFANFSFAQNPSLKVIDTDFSKGRLTNEQQITLSDVAKFHGHLCDGLVVGFLGLRQTIYLLFSDSMADRTNLRIVSKSSPCLTDIGIYLTGARYQFNTFYVSDSISYAFIFERIDTKKAYGVKLKPGIKPTQIDSLGNLATKGKLMACDLDVLHKMEDDFTEKLLAYNPKNIFIIDEILNFNWNPILNNTFIKTDILNKQKPICK